MGIINNKRYKGLSNHQGKTVGVLELNEAVNDICKNPNEEEEDIIEELTLVQYSITEIENNEA